jgi:hypothetical protein
MIWTPIGNPVSVCPIRTVVADRPLRVAGPAQPSWSKYDLFRPSMQEGRAGHRRAQHDVDVLEQCQPAAS